MQQENGNPATEVLGFDLGHGESALALTMVSTTTEPQILEIQGEKAFITAVAKHPRRGIIIGGDAYAARDLNTLRVGFKNSNLDRPDVREPIKLLVQKILECLLSDRKIKGDEETHFIVGCPSGWDKNTRTKYAMLLREAGLRNVTVIAESRAAFLHAKEANELRVSQDRLAGSVLIIDIGSSTTDFTAVVNFKESYIDFGHTQLGAGLLDKAILERALARHEKNEDLVKIFNTYPQYEAMCELRCRKAKEMFFSNESKYVEEPAGESLRIPTETRILFEVDVTQRDMTEILSTPLASLNHRSWPEVFRQTLLHAKERLKDNPPDLLLLTGGASRMGFTLEICEEIFPDSIVLRGAEPQFAIAKGLAWAGRVDRKAQAFLSEVEHLITSESVEQAVSHTLPALLNALAELFAHELPSRFILPAFEDWREGRIKTLADLEPVIASRFDRWLESDEGTQCLTPVVIKWVDTMRPEIEKLTNPICDKYGIPRAALALPSEKGLSGLIPSGLFDPTAIMGLDGLATVVSVIISTVVATLAGGAGTAFLFHGPIGWVVGFVVALFALAMGYQRATEWVSTADLPVFTRKVARMAKIVAQLEANEAELKEKIRQSIQSNQHAMEVISQEISHSIEQQLQKAADGIIITIK